MTPIKIWKSKFKARKAKIMDALATALAFVAIKSMNTADKLEGYAVQLLKESIEELK